MRRTALLASQSPASLTTLLLSIFIFAAFRLSSAANPLQQYVVCIDIRSDECVAWLANFKDAFQLSRKLYPGIDYLRDCGFSQLRVIPPHQKIITVAPYKDGEGNIIFCNVARLTIIDVHDRSSTTNPNNVNRIRRQAPYSLRGRYRGQTQSQYLAIDRGTGKDDGKAEAHSAADSSRASVSGSSGMGQAQSQTMYDPSCDDCVGRTTSDAESLKRGPFGSQGSSLGRTPIGSNIPGSGPYGVSGSGRPDGNGNYGPSHSGGPGGSTLYGTNGHNGFGPDQNGGAGGGVLRPNLGGDGSTRPGTYGLNQNPPGSGGYGGPSHGVSNGGGPGVFTPNQHGVYGSHPGESESYGGAPAPGVGVGGSHGSIPGSSGGYSPNQVGPAFPGAQNSVPHGIGTDNFQGGSPGGNAFGPNQGGSYSPPNQLLMPGSGGSGNYVPSQHRSPSGTEIYGPPLNGIPGGTDGKGVYGPGQQGLQGGTGSGPYRPFGGTVDNRGFSPSQNGLSPTSFAPGHQGSISQFGPNQPGQAATTGPYGGSNWPSTKVITGPDGITYYCCVAGPNNNPQYFKMGDNNLARPYGIGSSAGPNEPHALLSPTGPYGKDTPGGNYGVKGPTGIYGTPSEQDNRPFVPGSGGTNGPYGAYGTRPTQENTYPGPYQTGTYRGPDGLSQTGGNYSPGGLQTGIGMPGGAGTYGQGPSGGQGGLRGPGNIQGPDGTQGHGGLQVPGNLQAPSGMHVQGGPGGMHLPGGIPGQGGLQGQGDLQGPGGSRGVGLPGQGGLPGQSGLPGGLQGQGGFQGLGGIPGQGGLPGGLQGQGGLQGPGGIPGQGGLPGGLQGQGGLQGPGGIPGQGGLPGGLQGQGGLQGPGGIPGQGGLPGGLQGQGGIQGPGGIPLQGSLPGGLQGQGGVPGQGSLPGGLQGQGGLQGPSGIQGQHGLPRQDSLQGSGGIQGSGGPQGTGELQRPGGLLDQGNLQGSGGLPVQSGPQGPNGVQYGSLPSGVQNGLQGPVGQTGLQSPLNQYTPGVTTGQHGLQGPGGNSGTGSFAGQSGPQGTNGRYAPGTIGQGGLINQNIPGSTTGQDAYGGALPAGTYGTYGPSTGGQTSQHPYSMVPAGSQNVGGMNQYGQGAPGGQGGAPNQYGTGQGTHGPQYGNGVTGVGQYGNGLYGSKNNGNMGQNVDYGGVPQNVIDPNSIGGAIDGDDSEAEASVSQAANGTIANASSKGGNDKGRAQTHVHGAYTGGGSFSAQAEITGENKAANSEVTGDKKGASSNAQGSGRNNKSQANVQLGSETGSVLTGSQSEGTMHSSNTQVQGSVKGGMADAQARGPGSTSSQAQIGFTPYKEGDKSHDLQKIAFVGGGTAAAQSSGRTGSSQSQLRGTFKYGITYNGGAQAGASLDKDTVFSNRLPFDKINVYDENNKNINVNNENTERSTEPTAENYPYSESPPVTENILTLGEADILPSTELPYDMKMNTEKSDELPRNTENEYGVHTHSDHHKTDNQQSPPTLAPPVESRRSFQPTYSTNSGDYEYTTDKDDNPDDYDVDDGYGPEGGEPPEVEQGEYSTFNEFPRDGEPTHQSLHGPRRKGLEVRQTTGGNTQHIVLGSLKNHDAEITQRNSERPDESRVYQPGERIPGTGGYTIPVGFTGSVKSVASREKTYVVGSKDSPSQAQTVSLTPGHGKVKYTYPASYSRNVNPKNLRSLYETKPEDNNRYVSVSKSVTRDLDAENNIRKQYSHTYYTKSSSCGYFTFTCTMVSGPQGRKKVCKPKIPTNPDGTPMRC